MSLFDWGSESAEMRAIRARLEQEALYEQAVRMSNARNSTQFGGAGSAGVAESEPAVSNLFFYLTDSMPPAVKVFNVIDNQSKVIGMLPDEPLYLGYMATREVSPGTIEITVVGSLDRLGSGTPTYSFWRGITTDGSSISWQPTVSISGNASLSLGGMDWIEDKLYVFLRDRRGTFSSLFTVNFDEARFDDPISLGDYPLSGTIGLIGEGQSKEAIVVSAEGSLAAPIYSAATYSPSTGTWTPLFVNLIPFGVNQRAVIRIVEARPGTTSLLVNENTNFSMGINLLIFDPVTNEVSWGTELEDSQNYGLISWAAPSYSVAFV